MKLVFDVAAQDIVPGKCYTDGRIVFTADKVKPIADNAMVVVTKQGRRILSHNDTKVAAIG